MAPATVEAVETDPAEKSSRAVGRSVQRAASSDVDELLAWARDWNAAPDFKIRIKREEPAIFDGEAMAGWLEPLTEKVEDIVEYLRSRYGGGRYAVQLHVPNGKGGYQFGRQVTIKIPGNPILVGSSSKIAAAAPVADPLAERALNMTENAAAEARRQAAEERARADRAIETSGQVNADMLARLTRPLELQVEKLTTALEDQQRKYAELAAKGPPRDELRDRIIERAVEGDSQRVREIEGRYQQQIESLRANHESELRQLRQSHADAVTRLEHRHDSTVENMRRDHERTLDGMRRDHDRALADLKSAHEREIRSQSEQRAFMLQTSGEAQQARVESLKTQATRLEAENATLRTELAALRAVKEKSPADQLKELAGIKENLDNLTGGGGDDESPWVKIVGAIANAESVVRLVDKIGGGEEEADAEPEPPAPPQPLRPARRPQQRLPGLFQIVVNSADNKPVIHVGQGQYETGFDSLPAAQARQRELIAALRERRQLQAAQVQVGGAGSAAPAPASDDVIAGLEDEPGAPAPTPAPARLQPGRPQLRTLAPAAAAKPSGPAPKPPTTDQIEGAVKFLESALAAGTTAEQVVSTASRLGVVPENVLAYLRHTGMEPLLAAVQQFRPTSPLVTQRGRNYVREVGRLLGA